VLPLIYYIANKGGQKMVNFIICDDNKIIAKKVENIIDKIMFKNKIAYRKHLFYDYDNSFIKIIDNPLPSKIYVLDIETPSGSGIDMARKIRDKDMNSIIIFMTVHEELAYTILRNEFMFLSFINKYDDFDSKILSVLKKAIEASGKKLALRIEDCGILYKIPLKDILYITRDSVERKAIIKTEYSEFKINRTIVELLALLDDRFKLSHRACIVNLERIRVADFKKNIIIFDNNEKINLITKGFKKEVEK
jgi:two-component system response regulator AgrA